MLTDPPSRQVQSAQTVFKIINLLQDLGSATPTELTNQLELSKSSVHNYLATLETEGYVVNDGGNYRLGLRFLTHGVAAKNVLGIQNLIGSELQSIAEGVSYPTWWIAEEFGRGFFLQGTIPDGKASTYGKTGKRSYLHTHAPGKAILAALSDSYIEQIIDEYGLPQLTMKTTTNTEDLFEELKVIQEQGVASSEGEAVLGILSIGACFQDKEERTHAIGVFGQSRDLAGNQIENIEKRLVDSADSLEDSLQRGDH